LSAKARIEIAVYPLGTGDASISREVSEIFKVLDKCELPYQITPVGTIIEGTVDELFTIARELHDVVFSDTVKRVVTVIKLDDRR